MKPSPGIAAVIAALLAFPAPSAVAQPSMYTRGTLNGNICRSQGNNCHVPRPLNPVAPPPHMITNQSAPSAATPLAPASHGFFSRMFSKVTSIF